jgi:broad specificity phosphatase PhoE
MQKVILIRHGDRGEDYRLNKDGIKQAKLIAKSLMNIVQGETSLISSSALRAIQTSEIIAKILSLPLNFERSDYLWGANDSPRSGYLKSGRNVYELANLIEVKATKENLIVVSHLESTNDLATHYLSRYLDKDKPFRNISYGEGILIDFPLKIFEYLPKRI